MADIGHNGCPPMNPAADHAAIMAGAKRFLSSAPQQIVARKIGATRQTVSNYLNGNREPRLLDLCIIARAAGLRLALVPVED